MSVCSTRNETVTFLYSLITEINLEVDTEKSMGRGEHTVGKTGIKVERLSNNFLCMSLTIQSLQSRAASVLLFKLSLTKEVNRGCQSFLKCTRVLLWHEWKLILNLKTLKYLVDDEHFIYWCWSTAKIKRIENLTYNIVLGINAIYK